MTVFNVPKPEVYGRTIRLRLDQSHDGRRWGQEALAPIYTKLWDLEPHIYFQQLEREVDTCGEQKPNPYGSWWVGPAI